MARAPQRWHEVTRSQFTHEAEGLRIIREMLPRLDPFRAWSNFEFRDGQGKWHEVDLLIVGQRRLHLVELKYYSGVLRGDDLTWRRDGHRAEDSPLKLARRKAQRLASKLQDQLSHWAREHGQTVPDPRQVVPWVQECVFLHHPDLRCLLPEPSRIDLFGPDGAQHHTGLPGISQRLLEPTTPQQSVAANRSAIIAELMSQIGVVQRRQREAGTWVIDEEPLGEGDGWQDWPAFHRVATTDRARIRFLVTPAGAPAATRATARRVAEHEYRIMSRLSHDGLLSPRDLVETDLGPGLVYPHDGRFQRLDLWLADNSGQVPVTELLSLLRQVAEAVGYAHRNRVVHRGLSPHAVLVRRQADGALLAQVGDWQSAGAIGGTAQTGVSGGGITGLLGAEQLSPQQDSPQRAGSGQGQVGGPVRIAAPDADRRLAEAFQAPEGVWTQNADRVRLDVFALGALAYYLLAGRPAAADRLSLRERLYRDNGLDLAAALPQVPARLRLLVLDATRPAVTDRLPDARTFLARLDEAERAEDLASDEAATDPLDAPAGTVLDDRFRLERRLGRGSTAVGLLVTDLAVGQDGPEAARVLKVAMDDAAAARLEAEAEVLRTLNDRRLVRLVEGPVLVGGRCALVLEPAGDQTLAEVLRERERLSLDLLERWGTELLEALVALERAGVDHRDIKPANLGVREGRSDRVKHLVLFDFSLARAGATAVTAGTPPYLDPFLGEPGRGRYDSAAERYSAGVVLFEMATGVSPQFGDGMSDPASVRDEAAMTADMFDPAVADGLTGFFRAALARKAAQRHDTAADMLAAWQGIFAPVPRSQPDDADQVAGLAQPSTPLAEAGLSARALSAVEQFGVRTVADLVAVDPVRLNAMSGAAHVTKTEVKSRAADWRRRLGPTITGRGRPANGGVPSTLPDPVTAAELLAARAGGPRAQSRRRLARLLLGLDAAAGAEPTSAAAGAGIEAFASQAGLSEALGVTAARTAQQIAALQDAWASDPECRDLLDCLAYVARQALADLGGVAGIGELVAAGLAVMPPAAGAHPDVVARITAGLLRVALDRAQALGRAGDDAPVLTPRRRRGRIILLASDPTLLDPAEALGRRADQLVAQADAAGEVLIPAARAVDALADAWRAATHDRSDDASLPGRERLLRLASVTATQAALSGAMELHDRGLDLEQALSLALTGAAGGHRLQLSAQEVRDRVRARFPALPPLPDRPRLDELVGAAGLELRYDQQERAYRPVTRPADTAGLTSRPLTVAPVASVGFMADEHADTRLADSKAARSFLALGVDARKLDKATEVLGRRFGTARLDVTGVLIEAMRAQAKAVGLAWDTVRAADAAPSGSREREGLGELVRRSLPSVEAAIDAAAAGAPDGTRPVVLTEVSPLARYGQLAMLAPRADLTVPRRQAIWVLVPQLPGNYGAVVDGRPLPLAAPAQFFRVESDWIDRQAGVQPTGVPA